MSDRDGSREIVTQLCGGGVRERVSTALTDSLPELHDTCIVQILNGTY